MKNTVKIFFCFALASIFFTACEFGFDTRPDAVAPEFFPVQTITGIPTGSLPYVEIPLSSAVVMPENATNKRIEWSISGDGGTNSTLDEGNRLTANNEGTVTVTAVIKSGLGEDKDYTQNFSIRISIRLAVPVEWISGIPTTLTMGIPYTLQGIIKPLDSLNQTITWSVKDAGTTGASIYGNILTTTSSGIVVITANIFNGLIDKDYTQDFLIEITRPVYTSGWYRYGDAYGNTEPFTACYWIDKDRFDLDLTGVPTDVDSYTTGIVFAGNKMYISGSYGSKKYNDYDSIPTTACYWVVDDTTGPGGILHKLDNPATETLSIAADGTTVYITGHKKTLINDPPSNWYFWKIEGNGTVTPTELQTTLPAYTVYPRFYEGRIAVSGGKVYIPFYCGTPPNGYTPWISYYYDENGAYHKIADNFAASSAAIINGRVYFAGYSFYEYINDYGYLNEGKKLSYLTMGNEPVSFYKNKDETGNSIGDNCVKSIITQNDKIWFYCTNNSSSSFRFDAEGNQPDLPDNNFGYNTGIVTYSEGDVYIALTDGNDGVGYTVLGKQICMLFANKEGEFKLPRGVISGIAIRSSL